MAASKKVFTKPSPKEQPGTRKNKAKGDAKKPNKERSRLERIRYYIPFLHRAKFTDEQRAKSYDHKARVLVELKEKRLKRERVRMKRMNNAWKQTLSAIHSKEQEYLTYFEYGGLLFAIFWLSRYIFG